MRLTPELVQPIVDKTIEILGRNINIMNAKGVIIGSGQKERLNTFHQGAAWVIKHKKTLEIHAQDIDRLEGVKPGVNLPVFFNGETVGVVGITGQPHDVRSYGELVRMTVQMMLQQAFATELLEVEARAKENLVFDLIFGSRGQDEDDLVAGSQVLGYDLRAPRHALVIQLSGGGFDSTPPDTAARRALEGFFQEAQGPSGDPRPLFAGVGVGRFVVLKSVVGNRGPKPRPTNGAVVGELKDVRREGGELPEEAIRGAARLKEHLAAATGLSVTVGIGGYYPEVRGLTTSFREALTVLETGLRLKGSGGLYHRWNLGFARLIGDIPEVSRRRFTSETLGPLDRAEKGKRRELFTTLEQFLADNLNVALAARHLFIHRNTLLYRLKRIAELTGLDPRDFASALELQMAITLQKYDGAEAPWA